jgi:hypothetical protein
MGLLLGVSVTASSIVIAEKLMVVQLAKKLPNFYEVRTFITNSPLSLP